MSFRPLAIALFCFLTCATLRASESQRILLVVTNHDRIAAIDKPTGYWLAEVAHAWVRFVDAGYAVDIASPAGGPAPMDPRSRDLNDAENQRFWTSPGIQERMDNTLALDQVDPAAYVAIYFAGGHGTMWDFPGNAAVDRVTSAIWEQGGVVAAVCHGPAALVDVTLSDGSHLVAGRALTAFSNSEEAAVQLTEAVPFLLADRLAERGAMLDIAADFQPQVVVDGRLVTGQNPASAAPAAERMISLLQPTNP